MPLGNSPQEKRYRAPWQPPSVVHVRAGLHERQHIVRAGRVEDVLPLAHDGDATDRTADHPILHDTNLG